MRTTSSARAAILALATLLGAASCASNMALNDPCGNPCANQSCPEHMHCSASRTTCAASCEADYPAGPIK